MWPEIVDLLGVGDPLRILSGLSTISGGLGSGKALVWMVLRARMLFSQPSSLTLRYFRCNWCRLWRQVSQWSLMWNQDNQQAYWSPVESLNIEELWSRQVEGMSGSCAVHHSAQALSPFKDNLRTRQTLTRDWLGEHLPDMSPPKEGEIWRLPGPVQTLSKSTIEHNKWNRGYPRRGVTNCQPN